MNWTSTRRVQSSAQTTLRVDPLDHLVTRVGAVLDADAEARADVSRQEHARLRDEMARVVAAAPVRLVRACNAMPSGCHALELECGHTAYYYKPCDQMRCHECAGQASPTRRPF